MQNRYTGDIGDFSKYLLLRRLQSSGLSIGVNWYLVPDEKHNSDGRFTQYFNDENMIRYDRALCRELKQIVDSGNRVVSELEKEEILKARYFSGLLDYSGKSKAERAELRSTWHTKALQSLKGPDIITLDPDNGLIVPSAAGTAKENKYVKPEEIADYYRQGSSVIYYQHKARKTDCFYIDQHRSLLESGMFSGAAGLGVKFIKTSQRYYFFILQPEHKDPIYTAVNEMLATYLSSLFTLIYSE